MREDIDTMAEEISDWFLYPDLDSIPLYFWWISEDAGIHPVELVLYPWSEEPDEFQNRWGTEPPSIDDLLDQMLEQLNNANPQQLRGYIDARVAWLNRA